MKVTGAKALAAAMLVGTANAVTTHRYLHPHDQYNPNTLQHTVVMGNHLPEKASKLRGGTTISTVPPHVVLAEVTEEGFVDALEHYHAHRHIPIERFDIEHNYPELLELYDNGELTSEHFAHEASFLEDKDSKGNDWGEKYSKYSGILRPGDGFQPQDSLLPPGLRPGGDKDKDDGGGPEPYPNVDGTPLAPVVAPYERLGHYYNDMYSPIVYNNILGLAEDAVEALFPAVYPPTKLQFGAMSTLVYNSKCGMNQHGSRDHDENGTWGCKNTNPQQDPECAVRNDAYNYATSSDPTKEKYKGGYLYGGSWFDYWCTLNMKLDNQWEDEYGKLTFLTGNPAGTTYRIPFAGNNCGVQQGFYLRNYGGRIGSLPAPDLHRLLDVDHGCLVKAAAQRYRCENWMHEEAACPPGTTIESAEVNSAFMGNCREDSSGTVHCEHGSAIHVFGSVNKDYGGSSQNTYGGNSDQYRERFADRDAQICAIAYRGSDDIPGSHGDGLMELASPCWGNADPFVEAQLMTNHPDAYADIWNKNSVAVQFNYVDVGATGANILMADGFNWYWNTRSVRVITQQYRTDKQLECRVWYYVGHSLGAALSSINAYYFGTGKGQGTAGAAGAYSFADIPLLRNLPNGIATSTDRNGFRINDDRDPAGLIGSGSKDQMFSQAQGVKYTPWIPVPYASKWLWQMVGEFVKGKMVDAGANPMYASADVALRFIEIAASGDYGVTCSIEIGLGWNPFDCDFDQWFGNDPDLVRLKMESPIENSKNLMHAQGSHTITCPVNETHPDAINGYKPRQRPNHEHGCRWNTPFESFSLRRKPLQPASAANPTMISGYGNICLGGELAAGSRCGGSNDYTEVQVRPGTYDSGLTNSFVEPAIGGNLHIEMGGKMSIAGFYNLDFSYEKNLPQSQVFYTGKPSLADWESHGMWENYFYYMMQDSTMHSPGPHSTDATDVGALREDQWSCRNPQQWNCPICCTANSNGFNPFGGLDLDKGFGKGWQSDFGSPGGQQFFMEIGEEETEEVQSWYHMGNGAEKKNGGGGHAGGATWGMQAGQSPANDPCTTAACQDAGRTDSSRCATLSGWRNLFYSVIGWDKVQNFADGLDQFAQGGGIGGLIG